ncbi:hypothetical protein [uncultured Flavonifractor sp.]|uniref:hypothetical protein n=1 Tax=uncultured Flavonifractor sp. TaxID=1193534 RepID=UPI00262FEE9B|nr:hypothetical protein [uncultured Flavonifractor sp.]
MVKFLALLKLNFRAALAALRMGGRKRSVSGVGALVLLAGLSLYISGLYSFLFASQLAPAGALPLLIVFMSLGAVLLGFLFSLFAAQGMVFGTKDNDLMLALPVTPFALMLSRTLALYLENLISTLFVLLPAGVIYLWYGGPGGIWVLPTLLVCALFLNFLPTLLSLVAGFVLAFLSSRATHKALMGNLFNLIFLALLLVGSFSLSSNMGELGDAASGIHDAFQGWGLPFLLTEGAVCRGSVPDLLLLCALCLLPFLAVVWLFARRYKSIVTGLTARSARSDYKLGRLSAAGQRRALLVKEARRWFGTPMYLFNTCLGLIMLPGAGVAALIYRSSIQDFLSQIGWEFFFPLLIVGVCFCLSTVAITGSSISLEGKNLWLLKSAPISPATLFGAKVGFQLLACLPSLVVGTILLTIAFELPLWAGVLMLLDGLLFALVCAPFGLWINLHFPKLDAVNDTAVVKQSVSAFLSTLLPMVLVLVFFLLWLPLMEPLGALGLTLLYTGVLAAAVFLSFWVLIRQGPALFRQLSD